MIEAKQLAKAFGDVQAVSDVSFCAPDGRVTGLLGPNGAGKSTTLRMLNSILRPDSGSASVDRVSVHEQPLEARARMGVLPHAPGLYQNLTARENVRYFGRLYGLSGNPLEQRIEELFTLLDLHDFADRRAKGFSQGQRTKVALARAMVHNPGNLLLDEPTNGLDVMATRSLRDLIRHFRQEGRCVLFSSHIMQEVAALCDEIVIIAHGRVVASGTSDALRERFKVDDLEDAFVQAIGSEEGLQ